MNVLSLFDGMSCARQALERSGIKVDKYFASEIDKYAIQVTQHNYPDTIQLGSVVDVDGYKLPKIDLLCGGSPCQSFSFAGKRKGMVTKCETEILTLENYLQLKSEGYEFEGQSYLFWEFMRILKEVKPKYFLLENVMMGEKWEKILSKAIGCNPICINSALVSAQNRRRLFWTNIGTKSGGLFGYPESIISQPKDRNILLKDILESEVDEKYFIKSERMLKFISDEWRQKRKYTQIDGEKGLTAMARMYASWCGDFVTDHAGCLKFGRTDEAKEIRKENMKNGKDSTPFQAKEITGIGFDKMNTITSSATKDNLIIHNMMPRSSKTGKGGTGHLSKTDNKTYCLDTGNTNAIEYESKIRRLTPTECERLQTVKDGHTSIVSDSQRYKMLGNGWTVDVVAHIFSYII